MKLRFLLLSIVVSLLFSCSDNTAEPLAVDAPKIKRIVTSPDSMFFTGERIVFSVLLQDPSGVRVQWSLNGEAFSSVATVDYTPMIGGRNTVKVVAQSDKGRDSLELMFDVLRPRGSKSSKWISRVFNYTPAPGQFINTSSGNEQATEGLIGKRGMVSLGGYGGSIVFGFDHTVINGSGTDFVIHGNAFEGSSEPGAVAVAFDANGNGLPDDEFYELCGSAYQQAVKNLGIKYLRPTQIESAESIEWTTTQGQRGKLEKVEFHGQCYYPLFGENSQAAELNFTGNLVSNPSVLGDDGIWATPALEWGYADNYTADYEAAVGDDPQTARSNKFDISKAVAADGKAINLSGVDFIKVYTCVNEQAGPLGESSSDVCGAISLTKVR